MFFFFGRKRLLLSRSLSSIDKCQNCKVGRCDSGLNPRPNSSA